ncbi:hypothetical protein K491DRAFT_348407 [Lophiostoma macrostomum CBS 122681]|uniref:Secreted protein n=1 Tax=Lophiostoma macrostomum CBS 122681 TaxID=1314788 RepID=A0A6A6TCM5_9PLEO|nr:hypothetical protein K491DRAFT_348407 [Lophiostoma macrostomum CBS 122681]
MCRWSMPLKRHLSSLLAVAFVPCSARHFSYRISSPKPEPTDKAKRIAQLAMWHEGRPIAGRPVRMQCSVTEPAPR